MKLTNDARASMGAQFASHLWCWADRGRVRMRRMTGIALAGVLCSSWVLGEPRSVLSAGPFPDELAVLEAAIRLAVEHAKPSCRNHGSREAYCLSLSKRNRDPPKALLDRLADVRPTVMSLSSCREKGIVGRQTEITDPLITIRSLKVLSKDRVRVELAIFCGSAQPVLHRTGQGWSAEAWGWVGSCLLPSDCES